MVQVLVTAAPIFEWPASATGSGKLELACHSGWHGSLPVPVILSPAGQLLGRARSADL